MARLKDQKKSTNFVNRIFEQLVPMRSAPEYLPSFQEHENGLNYLNKLFMDAVAQQNTVNTMFPYAEAWGRYETPGFGPKRQEEIYYKKVKRKK